MIRHHIKRLVISAVIAGAAFGLNAGTAHAEPANDALNGTTVELARDAQAFINGRLLASQTIKSDVPWPLIVDLNNGFDRADLQEKRDIDTLGVVQVIAARTFMHYQLKESAVACLTGAMVAAYANHHQVTNEVSRREMLYALAYTQFTKPGAFIEEGIAATTMMDFPKGVSDYDLGVTKGNQACYAAAKQQSQTRYV